MLFGTLFTLPSNSVLIGAIGSTSNPFVSDFVPLIELVVGIALGIFVVSFVMRTFITPMHNKNHS